MPTALILIADGTEEIEFVTPYDGTPYLPLPLIQALKLRTAYSNISKPSFSPHSRWCRGQIGRRESQE